MKSPRLHYFISDAHFGCGFGNEAERVDSFYSFCETITGSECSVTIVGDFFDFWIEYKNVIRSDYFKALAALKLLQQAEIPLRIIRGNHDFMSYRFFEKEFGAEVLDGHHSLKYGAHAVHICHGDDLRGDWKYRLLHKILKSPTAQRVFCSVHPSLGIGLAESLSRLSRKNSGKTGRYLSDERHSWYQNRADQILLETGDSIFIMGHTHRADINRTEHGIYANSGAWLDSPTVLILTDEQISLCRFTPNTEAPFSEISRMKIDGDS